MPLTAAIAATAVALPADRHRPAWVAAGQARRLDPLVALACAAIDRLPGLDTLPPTTAVVAGSGWGCVESTVRVCEGMAAYGDAGGSPTAFTTSVHHNPAGTIGELRGLHGPAQTVSLGGCSGIAALRSAALLLAAGRAPAALVVIADLANLWWARTMAGVCRTPFAIGGGATAMLLAPGGTWIAGFASGPATLTVDAGGGTPGEELALARRGGPGRRCAARLHGAWWPTAAFAAAPWAGEAPFMVREIDCGRTLEAWFTRA